MGKFYKFIVELTRRKVIRVSGAYVAIVWLLAQVVADIFPAFGLPDWTVRAFIIAGVLCLPIVIVLAWKFDITPRGVIRDPGPLPDDMLAGRSLSLAQMGAGFGISPGAGPGVVRAQWSDDQGNTQSKDFFGSFLIGRDATADIYLSDPRVSRRHTIVFVDGSSWHVKDLGSSNGTYLDGRRVESKPLPDSCTIQLQEDGPTVQIHLQSADATLVPSDNTDLKTRH